MGELDEEEAYQQKLEKTKQLRERLMFEYNNQVKKDSESVHE
jgi:protease II